MRIWAAQLNSGESHGHAPARCGYSPENQAELVEAGAIFCTTRLRQAQADSFLIFLTY